MTQSHSGNGKHLMSVNQHACRHRESGMSSSLSLSLSLSLTAARDLQRNSRKESAGRASFFLCCFSDDASLGVLCNTQLTRQELLRSVFENSVQTTLAPTARDSDSPPLDETVPPFPLRLSSNGHVADFTGGPPPLLLR